MVKLIYMLFLLYYLPANSILADGIIKEQTLPTSQGKTLYVKAFCGDVNVTTWSKDEANIKIYGNDNAKEYLKFDIEEKNGNIHITITKKDGITSTSGVNLKIDASIPEKYNAEVSSAGGDLKLSSIKGNLELKTAGGNIILNEISGTSELKTAGGDIKVSSYSGVLEAKTAGGNIDFYGSDCKISAKTAGGNITVKYSGENKGIELSSTGGDIKLFVPENFSANINLSTNGGDIKSDIDIKGKYNSSKSKINGTTNNGGEEVSCKSNGGNITIEKLK